MIMQRSIALGARSLGIVRDRQRIVRWGERAGFAVADQGVFSGANFLMNVLLVRWLTPGQYGAFAIAFGIFLFLSGFHNALLQEPASILGASMEDAALPTYLGDLFWLHIGLTSLIGATFALGSQLIPSADLREAVCAMSLATPLILLEWLLRRACYLRSDARGAFLSSCVYTALLLLGIVILHRWQMLSPGAAYGATAVASIGGVAQRWRRLHIHARLPWRPDARRSIMAILRSHWAYGRWVSLQAILLLGGGYFQTLAAGWFIGLSGAGVLRAVGLLSLPISQAMTALGSVLGLPLLARKYALGDQTSFRRNVALLTWFFVALAAVYELGLILFQAPIASFLLKDQAAALGWLIPIVGLGPIVGALSTTSLALRAGRQTYFYPLSGAMSAVAGVVTAPLFILLWGVPGAVISSLLATACVTLLAWYLYRRWRPAVIPPETSPGVAFHRGA